MKPKRMEQRWPVWGLGKKENRMIWEGGGSWEGSPELREHYGKHVMQLGR